MKYKSWQSARVDGKQMTDCRVVINYSQQLCQSQQYHYIDEFVRDSNQNLQVFRVMKKCNLLLN